MCRRVCPVYEGVSRCKSWCPGIRIGAQVLELQV